MPFGIYSLFSHRRLINSLYFTVDETEAPERKQLVRRCRGAAVAWDKCALLLNVTPSPSPSPRPQAEEPTCGFTGDWEGPGALRRTLSGPLLPSTGH